jgi:cell wall assembly regulator SMI1
LQSREIDIEFNPGTTIDKIREAERKLNLELPSQLSELLLIADGQKQKRSDGGRYDFLLPAMKFGSSAYEDHYSDFAYLCGVDEMVENNLLAREVYEIMRSDGFEFGGPDNPHEKFGPVTAHESMIEISSAGNAASISVDLDPPSGGTYGQLVALNEQPWAVGLLARDLIEYLEILTDGYRSGRFFRHDFGVWSERPVDEDSHPTE